ncbi:sigma factor-like helix-turn-helix DNA-binding protein [Streptomyces sp. AK02-01A]|uniref:sigma factor-like helix-turn-helix DNA-binding protein n=1 Tax=Streptomyces sp. AK02-01A TaxID=3028648 RepID=UPI0029B83686|nr:sigma factor-like helix-turn-helix DNA-binding protein [Streptomyces sp. AK02-01A]MDX3852408.1 sigma factor-like helix-turn-helix DNA-binding protein [Streptomyces sp. AK02-01A]
MARAINGGRGVADRGLQRFSDRPERRLALTFDAFDAHHHTLWLRYAHTQVGSRAAAETVVDALCARLLDDWPHALVQESVPQYAWAVLKEEVARWLREHDLEPVLVDTAAFLAAIRKLLLYEMRDQFAVLQGEIGLYAAISRLPERQYDVVVLRYVLRIPDEVVAEYMGIEVATVRSHVRHARRRLAKDLDVRETKTEE